MKRNGYTLAVIAVALSLIVAALVACGGGGSDGQSRVQDLIDADKQEIKDAINGFLSGMERFDTGAMKEYATDNGKDVIDIWESAMNQIEEEGIEIISMEISNIQLEDGEITLDMADRYQPDDQINVSEWRDSFGSAAALSAYHLKMVANVGGDNQSEEDTFNYTFIVQRSDETWLIDHWFETALE